MRESMGPLLRGTGTLVLLVAAIAGQCLENRAQQLGGHLPKNTLPFDTSKPFSELGPEEQRDRTYRIVINNLADQVSDLHHDLQKKSIASIMIGDSRVEWITFTGSSLIVLSFYCEYFAKRKKERNAGLEAANEHGPSHAEAERDVHRGQR